ncbi:MAG: hypothetical protein ACLFOC_09230 [Campylobacterales bacterium]
MIKRVAIFLPLFLVAINFSGCSNALQNISQQSAKQDKQDDIEIISIWEAEYYRDLSIVKAKLFELENLYILDVAGACRYGFKKSPNMQAREFIETNQKSSFECKKGVPKYLTVDKDKNTTLLKFYYEPNKSSYAYSLELTESQNK